jgi:Flp pilus assembly protein TadD
MATDPVPSEVRRLYALSYLLPIGRVPDAAHELRRSLDADPLDVHMRCALSSCLAAVGRYAEAASEAETALEIDDRSFAPHGTLSTTHLLRGDIVAALRACEHAFRLAPWDVQVTGMLAGLLARTGAQERADTLVQQLLEGPHQARAALGMAMYHGLCSNVDAVADWSQKAVELRDPRVPFVLWSPILEPLRSSLDGPRSRR